MTYLKMLSSIRILGLNFISSDLSMKYVMSVAGGLQRYLHYARS